MTPAPPDDDAPRVRPWTIWMLVAVIAVGGVVGTQILFKKVVPEAIKKDQRLPYVAVLERDIEATESHGGPVRLGQLAGKVYLIAYVYSTCPRGCAGIVEKMIELQKKFAGEPRFHLVSVSVHPTHDTPEQLTKFAEAQEIDRSNWWFLTGDLEALRYFMTKQVRLDPVRDIPEAERLNEFDLFDHDQRVALVDGNRRVRGYYEVMAPDPGISRLVMEKLERDIRAVLAEPAE
jgi:cytochrome oxidase Cu insertion factor (SCO1/SenC/PrrC family)